MFNTNPANAGFAVLIASISLIQSRATPKACEVKVRGLPVLILYVALSGYRRPGLPEGCPSYR